MPDFIDLTPDDLATHHLCCALGDKKHADGVARKKAWLRERFAEGLVFRKLDVRGKVFIEYMPGETCWRPVVAPGWFVVHCLWVSGRFAKQGHGQALVESALEHAAAAGKAGLVIACSKKKRPFLSDPRFLRKLGFAVVDEHDEWRLMAKAVGAHDAPTPRFSDAVRSPRVGNTLVASVSAQCPFNTHWAPQVVDQLRARGFDAAVEWQQTAADAQATASPLGTYSLEGQGDLWCHHLTTAGATDRMLVKRGEA